MTTQIFSIMFPLIFIVSVGYLYGSKISPEMGITNQMNMNVFIPALIFHVMIQDGFHPSEYFALMMGGTLVIVLSGVLAFLLARLLGYRWRMLVPPAMFSNWANLGLPLYVLAFGEQALDGGVMLVVVGNVLCFTFGIFIYAGKLSAADVLKTPVMLAVIFGGIINGIGFTMPTYIDLPIGMMGQVAIPLMLFSLGVRLTRTSLEDYKVGLIMAAFCPLVGVLIAIGLMQVIHLDPLQTNILILFGALPPAVINFMLAEQYNLEPERVASIVLIANVASLLSIPVVLYFLLGNMS